MKRERKRCMCGHVTPHPPEHVRVCVRVETKSQKCTSQPLQSIELAFEHCMLHVCDYVTNYVRVRTCDRFTCTCMYVWLTQDQDFGGTCVHEPWSLQPSRVIEFIFWRYSALYKLPTKMF